MGERARKKSSIGLGLMQRKWGRNAVSLCKRRTKGQVWTKESRSGPEVLGSSTFIWSEGPGAQEERQGKDCWGGCKPETPLALRLK